jgi:hypothetical protein
MHSYRQRPKASLGGSVLLRKGFLVMRLDLRLRRFVVCVGTVEAHAPCISGNVDVGAQDVPSLAQMQHPTVPLDCPTLGGDAKPFLISHMRSGEVSHGLATEQQENK